MSEVKERRLGRGSEPDVPLVLKESFHLKLLVLDQTRKRRRRKLKRVMMIMERKEMLSRNEWTVIVKMRTMMLKR